MDKWFRTLVWVIVGKHRVTYSPVLPRHFATAGCALPHAHNERTYVQLFAKAVPHHVATTAPGTWLSRTLLTNATLVSSACSLQQLEQFITIKYNYHMRALLQSNSHTAETGRQNKMVRRICMMSNIGSNTLAWDTPTDTLTHSRGQVRPGQRILRRKTK